MNKTFATKMPNHIGAFLKASRCFAELGVNITRVSYNKAVDSHMLFIDAEGTPEQLQKATEQLAAIGYLQCDEEDRHVVLLEFKLKDVPGSVTTVLELISDYNFNISYISSQENGTEYQLFKMGLIVNDDNKIKRFIDEAKKICEVRLIDYNHADKIYDNSFFYNTFVDELSSSMDISSDFKNELMINTNLAMQTLDETGISPYRTFDSISRFAELLALSRDAAFEPRITEHRITENTTVTLIEPPCGSNTAIIKSGEEYLFIDSGYACYKDEMLALIRKLVPGFDSILKDIFITHADVDHCGLLYLFDKVYASAKSAECLRLEYEGKDGYRETNSLHKPYVRICKSLTSYEPVTPDKVVVTGGSKKTEAPLEKTGTFDFGDLHFELYEGNGGHLKGESVLIDRVNRVAFTGDIFVNLKDMTSTQAEYNKYAPILMTSVDTDKDLCAQERKAFFDLLGSGEWQIFGGHGGKKDYTSQ
ncbi:MAG: MBL fold metallo-hydrolase [Saccharofermentans sp.]|nr:MBL fold metallo-hydrolase [Saccharofermentans sp.]